MTIQGVKGKFPFPRGDGKISLNNGFEYEGRFMNGSLTGIGKLRNKKGKEVQVNIVKDSKNNAANSFWFCDLIDEKDEIKFREAMSNIMNSRWMVMMRMKLEV